MQFRFKSKDLSECNISSKHADTTGLPKTNKHKKHCIY